MYVIDDGLQNATDVHILNVQNDRQCEGTRGWKWEQWEGAG